jgi:hypothetical protein
MYRTERGRLTIVLGLILSLVACAPAPSANVQVKVGDETISAYRDTAKSTVSIVSSGPGRSDVSGSFAYNALPGVRFLTYKAPGTTHHETYTYGVAPPGATQVEIDAPMAASAVGADGTFIVVTQGDEESQPLDLHWRFLSASGAVIAEGQGTRP